VLCTGPTAWWQYCQRKRQPKLRSLSAFNCQSHVNN
jgi:hypothetical protein